MKDQVKRRTKKFQQTFSEEALRIAWHHYLRSSQAEAKDSWGIKAFSLNLDRNLRRLSNEIMEGSFFPSNPAKFYKPKSLGTQRTITVPRIEDALVFQACAVAAARSLPAKRERFRENVFSAVLHSDAIIDFIDIDNDLKSMILSEEDGGPFFFESCFGHYNRFSKMVCELRRSGFYSHYLRADIQGFYDSIPHACLFDALRAKHGFTRDMILLFKQCLNAWSGTRMGPTPGVGIPQSVDASHFFADLYLHPIDEWLIGETKSYCRFMDDLYVFGTSLEQTLDIYTGIDLRLKSLGLSLNSRKTAYGTIDDANQSEDEAGDYYDIERYCLADSYDDNLATNLDLDGFPLELPIFAELDGEAEELVVLASERLKTIEDEVCLLTECISDPPLPHDRNSQGRWKVAAFRFCEAASLLARYGRMPKGIRVKAAEGWCLLLEAYPSEAESFTGALSFYRDSEESVDRLYRLLDVFHRFEYPRKHIVDIIPWRESFNSKRAERLLSILENEGSWYVRLSLYRLLLKGINIPDLKQRVLSRASLESEPTMRRELMFMLSSGDFSQSDRIMNLKQLGWS